MKGKKTGGRKLGSGNAIKIKTLREACEAEDFCFATALVKAAKAGSPAMIREGMKYLFSTAITVSGPNEGPIKTEVESSYDDRLLDDFEKLLETKLNETKRA